MERKIILASASPRRQELLGRIAKDFTVHPADIDEHLRKGAPLAEEVRRLALQKAKAVWEQTEEEGPRFIIGADTLVTIDGMVLGKPRDVQDAGRMLRLLSGRTHEVLTAVSVVTEQGRQYSAISRSKVTFYPLSSTEIRWYLSTGEPMDKAGAYAIQGRGALLVQNIAGDYYGVIGLPIAQLVRLLGQAK